MSQADDKLPLFYVGISFWLEQMHGQHHQQTTETLLFS